MDAPEVACDAEPAIIAMWSPVKCTSLSAIHGENPATRRMSRPVMSLVIPDSPPGVEYRLTERGRALGPVVEALRRYAAICWSPQ